MKKRFTDQMHRIIEVPFPPKRIISLVPSQTELLYDLGLADEVVGQTLFCIHPDEMHQTKPRVGGTKKIQFDKIAALQPDLIIGNKEENSQEQIEELMKTYPVWMSDIHSLEDALEMISKIGELVDKKYEAKQITQKIRSEFDMLTVSEQKTSTTYLIWRNPWMAAGHDTFINDLMKHCGLENVCVNIDSRYPEITDDEWKTLNPEVILLSSEPYPFKEQHIEELQHLCPQAKICLVDGELFSWYGSRLMKSVSYFNSLLLELHN